MEPAINIIISNTVEYPNKGLFGTNIIQVVCPLYRDCPLLRDSNRIILIGGIKFGDLVFVFSEGPI